VPRVGNPGSVTPPKSDTATTVKPQGSFYDGTGKCVEYPSWMDGLGGESCTTSRDLNKEFDKEKAAAEAATGDSKRREEARQNALRIQAQITLRGASGDDRFADQAIQRIQNSPYFGKLSQSERSDVWRDLSIAVKGTGNTVAVKLAISDVLEALENGIPKRDSQGNIVGITPVNSARAVSTAGSRTNIQASTITYPGGIDVGVLGGLGRILGGLAAIAGGLGVAAMAVITSLTLTGDSNVDPCSGSFADGVFKGLMATAGAASVPPVNGRNPVTGGVTPFENRTVATGLWLFNSKQGQGLAVSGTDFGQRGQRLYPNAVLGTAPSIFGRGGLHPVGNEDHAEIKLLDYASGGIPGPAVGVMYLYVTRQPCVTQGCQRSIKDFRAEYGDNGVGSQFRLCGRFGADGRPF
jgi:hypothetical protein